VRCLPSFVRRGLRGGRFIVNGSLDLSLTLSLRRRGEIHINSCVPNAQER
jgi:hypothetical protein